MASVSKQFTAAAIVLAAQQHFLSLDDDVPKHIPELPDYGHPITLRQMLHHTSGFRDFLALTYLAGRDISALSSPVHVLELIAIPICEAQPAGIAGGRAARLGYDKALWLTYGRRPLRFQKRRQKAFVWK
jgi:hypothetical protein